MVSTSDGQTMIQSELQIVSTAVSDPIWYWDSQFLWHETDTEESILIDLSTHQQQPETSEYHDHEMKNTRMVLIMRFKIGWSDS